MSVSRTGSETFSVN